MATRKDEIRRAMTPDPHTVGVNQPLAVAHRIMRANGIRHLPVLEQGKLVGVVSERDLQLLETLPGVDVETVRVEEAMTPDPWVVEQTMPLVDAVRYMAEHAIGSAIVVEDGHVVGVFTTLDALRVLADLLGTGRGRSRSPSESRPARVARP